MSNTTSEFKEKRKERKEKQKQFFDYTLVFLWMFIMMFGLVILYSAAMYIEDGPMSILKKTIIAIVIGAFAVVFLIAIDYRILKNFAFFIWAVSCILVILTAFLGKTSDNSSVARGLKMPGGLTLMTGEVVKIGVILYLSTAVAKCTPKAMQNLKNCVILYLWIVMLPAGLVLACTSNLSSAGVIMILGLAIMYVGGARKRHLVAIGGSLTAMGALVLLIASKIPSLTETVNNRLERVFIMLHPDQYDKGNQVLNSIRSVGSGGFFGRGLGNGMQKVSRIPEVHTDMIFSVVCEELGIFGAICVCAMFFAMLVRIKNIAVNSPDFYGTLLCMGIFTMFATHVVINIMVSMNLFPNTGITLPFFSYGATSTLVFMVCMGIVFSVSRRTREINKVSIKNKI